MDKKEGTDISQEGTDIEWNSTIFITNIILSTV